MLPRAFALDCSAGCMAYSIYKKCEEGKEYEASLRITWCVPSCSVQPQHLLLVLKVLAYMPQAAFELTGESSRHDEHTGKRTHSHTSILDHQDRGIDRRGKGGDGRARMITHARARSRI